MALETTVGKAAIDLVVKADEIAPKVADVNKKLGDIGKGAEHSEDVFHKLHANLAEIRKVVHTLIVPAAIVAGIAEVIGKMEEAGHKIEELKSAGDEFASGFRERILKATTDPEVSKLLTRQLKEDLASQLNSLRGQQEDLEGFRKSFGILLLQILGGPSKDEIRTHLQETGVEMQRELQSLLDALSEKEDAARREKETKDNLALYKERLDREATEKTELENQKKLRQEALDKELEDYRFVIEDLGRIEYERQQNHEAEMNRLEERHRRVMDNIREQIRAEQELRAEQERGFTFGDFPVASGSGGPALRGSVLARFGRGSGGRH